MTTINHFYSANRNPLLRRYAHFGVRKIHITTLNRHFFFQTCRQWHNMHTTTRLYTSMQPQRVSKVEFASEKFFLAENAGARFYLFNPRSVQFETFAVSQRRGWSLLRLASWENRQGAFLSQMNNKTRQKVKSWGREEKKKHTQRWRHEDGRRIRVSKFIPTHAIPYLHSAFGINN